MSTFVPFNAYIPYRIVSTVSTWNTCTVSTILLNLLHLLHLLQSITSLPYKSYFRNAQLCCALIMPNFSKDFGSWAPLYASTLGSRLGSRLGSWLGSWSCFPVPSWFFIRFNKTCIKLSYSVLQYKCIDCVNIYNIIMVKCLQYIPP